MLLGGVRNNQVTLNDLSAEFMRDASQTQDVFQNARAFSGAVNSNSLTQAEEISQSGTAANTKEVVIDPPAPNDNIPETFHNNYIYQVITDVDAANYLARGIANSQQDQLGGQSAFASLLDFDGNLSEAVNSLFQDELVEQKLELTEVQSQVTVNQPDWVWNNARFRQITLDAENHDAQAILSAEQRQGYTSADPALQGNTAFDAPLTQFAAADGAYAQNNLSQSVANKQTNTVLMENNYDLRRTPADTLSPRTAEILINVGDNQSINSESAVQTQALIQQAMGGVNEEGQATENGGFVQNSAMQIAEIYEQGYVEHVTNVLA
jgi:hypothetical protein